MARYYVVTLGCKLNQSDSARAEGILEHGDYVRTDDPAEADVIVLNTCTVTARADAEGRRLARQLRRRNPAARIVATGCYAERDPQALRALSVFDDVVGHAERPRLPAALLGEDDCVTLPVVPRVGDSARAFLAVQEGCDLKCSYCIIPSVRGPGRSTPAANVVAEARALSARGAREIGLTGVNVGSWGRDLAPRLELADLVEALLAAGLPLRIRLNSLEPRTVTPRLLELMAAERERIAPHVQVPLQSGSDRVLGLMSRNYRCADYARVIEAAAAAVPGICLGADVITAFPGETDDDHAQTRALLGRLPLGYLHVFSYSPRPGTRAAGLGGAVAPAVARERTAELRALGAAKARAFRAARIGAVVRALSLAATAPDGRRRALSGEYIEVLVPGVPAGEMIDARITAVSPDGVTVDAEVA